MIDTGSTYFDHGRIPNALGAHKTMLGRATDTQGVCSEAAPASIVDDLDNAISSLLELERRMAQMVDVLCGAVPVNCGIGMKDREDGVLPCARAFASEVRTLVQRMHSTLDRV